MSDFFQKMYSFVTYETAFVTLSTIVNVFFILYFFGFLKDKNELVETISGYLKIFIGIFLVVRFNPFFTFPGNSKKFTEFDRTVVFSAGCYVLIITGIGKYTEYLIKEENRIKKVIKPSELPGRSILSDQVDYIN
jgi:hypothetical protein